MKLFVCTLLIFLGGITSSWAQTPLEEEARKRLQQTNLSEGEVERKLKDKGIDVNNIDPSQIGEVEEALKEAVQEAEEEQAVKTEQAIKEDAAQQAAEIKEAVEDGKNLDEAIAEEVIEQQTEELPPSPIYGQQLFRNKTIKVYKQAVDVNPPESYVLGAGDKINISIWGVSQLDASYQINLSGFIKPTDMPRISLKGLTLVKAKNLLRKRFSRFYKFLPEEFEVTITYARTINVNIYGEVFNPGGYTIPATNTAFNALVASGGPSDIGSVRDIRLIRAGETKRLDVYEFMNDPAIQEDYYLRDNDIIYVDVVEKVIDIKGAVRRPAKYELLPKENLRKLIDYAGGLSDNAYQSNLQITRFVEDEQKIIDVNLRDLESGQDIDLRSGDIVTVKRIPKPFQNFVSIEGAIAIPGKYELTPNMRLSNLLQKGQLQEESRTDIAFLQRTNFDGTISYQKVNLAEALQNPAGSADIELKPSDKLIVYARSRYIDLATIRVSGAVREPGKHPFDANEQLRVSDAILLAGGLKPDAAPFAYIFRQDPINRKEKEYIRIDPKAASDNPGSVSDIVLEPFDSLRILSNLTYTDEAIIQVKGAVRNPGSYRYSESLTLKDVLTLAGGLKLEASASNIDIFRVVIEDNKPTETVVTQVQVEKDLTFQSADLPLQPFDQIVVRQVPDFEFQQMVTIEGEVRYPGEFALVDDNERLASIVERAGGLSSEAFPEGATLYREDEGVGFVVMNLKEALQDKKGKNNVLLKEGDRIIVPKSKDLVTINLVNTRAFDLYQDQALQEGKFNVPFEAGKSAKWYVDEYVAGVGETGKRSRITVEHPNGELDRTNRFLFFHNYPEVRAGSIISVGAKPVKQKDKLEDRDPIDWGQVVADSVAQATAILTLILLVQRLD